MCEIIVYEHPLNEIIRVCLRLEQLFHHLDHQLLDSSPLGSRHSIELIIQVLQILDRPDLKTKLAKELTHHLSNLNRYNNSPQIDTEKLQQLTQQLGLLSTNLIESTGKIANRLREVEFLNTLRLHLSSPGGGCSFDSPLFYFWLQQTPDVRQKMINHWISDFAQIRTTIHLALDLVRKNAKTEEKIASHGFHQELLDPQLSLRMIRIGLNQDVAAYPEISIGRHFLSVRFFEPLIDKRPNQYPQNLSFYLTYCSL